jgi:hypothetical protein
MIITSRYVLGAACVLSVGAAAATTPLLAQQNLGREGTSWHWDGAMTRGGSFKLFNVNGAIHFTPSSDGSVHVQAAKHVHSGGDPRTVHYAVVRNGNDVTICAMWSDNATCDADGVQGSSDREGSNGDRRRNVAAEFTVQIPAGVNTNGNSVNGDVSVERLAANVKANTVNGAVRVQQVTGQVEARSVNGDVDVDTRAGVVSAQTVNGAVHASMAADGNGDMRFRSVNGDVDITGPAQMNADVSLSTLNGSIDTRYPLNFDRRRRHADGVIGSGGRHLTASTVNGSISLK